MFTILNAVRLAIMQVGVLTVGVLGAGLCRKMCTMSGTQPPLLTGLVADYGFISLILPLVWITLAVLVHRMEASDARKNLMFFFGRRARDDYGDFFPDRRFQPVVMRPKLFGFGRRGGLVHFCISKTS